MEIRLLKCEDVSEIKKWLPKELHGDSFPRHTYCAVDEGIIIAVASMRMAEGEVCMIDSMASNPGFVGIMRHEALDRLTTTVLQTAQELGYKAIFGATKETTIVTRALKHGFVVVPQILIAKEL